MTKEESKKFCKNMLDYMERICPDKKATFTLIMTTASKDNSGMSNIECVTNMCPNDTAELLRDMAVVVKSVQFGN